MFCVVLFHCVPNVVFFLGKRKINFKHLIASWVNVGANLTGANSPWGETGSYQKRSSDVSYILSYLTKLKNQFNKLDRRHTKDCMLFIAKGSFCRDLTKEDWFNHHICFSDGYLLQKNQKTSFLGFIEKKKLKWAQTNHGRVTRLSFMLSFI